MEIIIFAAGFATAVFVVWCKYGNHTFKSINSPSCTKKVVGSVYVTSKHCGSHYKRNVYQENELTYIVDHLERILFIDKPIKGGDILTGEGGALCVVHPIEPKIIIPIDCVLDQSSEIDAALGL